LRISMRLSSGTRWQFQINSSLFRKFKFLKAKIHHSLKCFASSGFLDSKNFELERLHFSQLNTNERYPFILIINLHHRSLSNSMWRNVLKVVGYLLKETSWSSMSAFQSFTYWRVKYVRCITDQQIMSINKSFLNLI